MFLVNQVSEMVRRSKGLFSKRRRNESILLVMLLTFRCAILSPGLRPCHTIAYRTSVCQRMKNITHTPVYADIR